MCPKPSFSFLLIRKNKFNLLGRTFGNPAFQILVHQKRILQNFMQKNKQHDVR